MKFLKVILISVGIAFIVSLVLAVAGYTPPADRDPDTYYFSILENLLFSMFLFTPIILIVSILAFLVYIGLGKVGSLSKRKKATFSLLIAGSITALFIFINNESSETDDLYLIPEGYAGDIFVFYNIKGAPTVETENGYEVHPINEKGYYVTSTPDMDYGIVTDQYYYVDKSGNRTPISEKCISLFGTGGFSTSENEEVDLIYTGFRLTKDHCGEGFMTDSFSEEDRKQTLINEILEKYYGIEERF